MTTTSQPAPCPSRARRDVPAFLRAEDGALTVFGLIIFVIMLFAGGLALDLMRSEADRTKLQYTIDRASLAAASLKQSRDGREVVKDYLRAAGLDEDSVIVNFTEDRRGRRISLESNARTNSLFASVLGMDQMVQPVVGQARDEDAQLEMSLVLDISGSMRGDKLVDLKREAKRFLSELLLDREALTTVSIVPYNDRVDLGPVVAAAMPMSNVHGNSTCVVFEDAEFGRTHMDAQDRIDRMSHFDKTWPDGGPRNEEGNIEFPHCGNDDYDEVVAWSNDIDELNATIDALQADYWTAMDLGVKVGTLLLDPSMNPSLLKLTVPDAAGNTAVDPDFGDRPLPYGTTGAMKVLVVMTDGRNTYQWDLQQNRQTGPSGVFVDLDAADMPEYPVDDDGDLISDRGTPAQRSWSAQWQRGGNPTAPQYNIDIDGDGVMDFPWYAGIGRNFRSGYDIDLATSSDVDRRARYSFYDGRSSSSTFGKFYVPHLPSDQRWQDQPWGANAHELTNQELYGAMGLYYIRDRVLKNAPWSFRKYYTHIVERTHNQSRADTNLSNICQAARERGIQVFSIAFEAPASGEAAMKDCAGVDENTKYKDNYYNVSSDAGENDSFHSEIGAAFDGIRDSIRKLRLTQ